MKRAFVLIRQPLDEERRAMLPVQIVARWVLFALALLVLNFESRAPAGLVHAELNGLVLLAGAFNLYLHWRLVRGKLILALLPVTSAVLDVVAITAALRIIEGFNNLNFVMYYPELLAFTLLFPGLPSLAAVLVTAACYVGLVTTHGAFDTTFIQDWKDLAARLVTLVATVAIANLAVTIERGRRQRATAQAIAAHEERERVSREIHDGVAQGVYMLALNLDANARALEDLPQQSALRQRLLTLSEVAKHTLLDTRALLLDLEPVLAGEQPLDELLRHLAREFASVTGIEARVSIDNAPLPPLPPWAVLEIYRVVQEALANVFKHAGAQSAHVSVRAVDSGLRVEVIDDGNGFEPGGGREGYGLGNQRARAERLGGGLEIDSRPGEGTRLVLRVPHSPQMGG